MKKKSNLIGISILTLSAATVLFFSACEKDDCHSSAAADTGGSQRVAPLVPDSLQVPAGQVVALKTFATGVQIYVCTETSPGVFGWVFRAPDAKLYSSSNFNGQIGTHYAGPTWESTSGSKVVGARLHGNTVNTTAIPWLLLGAVSSQGPGVFEGVTYIQRVNTTGGLAPTSGANASTLGQEARVPYTADYYFFKPE